MDLWRISMLCCCGAMSVVLAVFFVPTRGEAILLKQEARHSFNVDVVM